MGYQIRRHSSPKHQAHGNFTNLTDFAPLDARRLNIRFSPLFYGKKRVERTLFEQQVSRLLAAR